jgi:uncharacterized protein
MPRVLLVLSLLLTLAACRGETPPHHGQPRAEDPTAEGPAIEFRQDGELTFYRPGEGDIVTIAIEIAETPAAIERGLMQREGLPERSGMLFLMPETRIQSFWMANTPISLDITFVGPDSTVVNTGKYTRPFSQQSVTSEAPARYVVETVAGFTDSYGIVPGDRVRWRRGPASGPTAAAP